MLNNWSAFKSGTGAPGGSFGRLLLRYAVSLAFLAVPAAITVALKSHPALNPVISVSFVIAVSAAAWWGGAAAGILLSFATIPVLTLAATGGKLFFPPHFDGVGLVVMCFIAILVNSVRRARTRVEEVLRAANDELEQRVRERTAELERARSWLQTTLSSIGDAVIATDQTGQVSFMNGVAENLTGWCEKEAHGRPLAEVFVIINETSRQPVDDPVVKVLRTGTITGLANHTILLSRKGSEIPIDDSAAPIFGEQNELGGVVLTFRDITERRRNEKAAEQARLTLERTNHELQQFAYAASHDLQEPLRNVSIYTQLLAHKYRSKLDETADQYIGFAVNGAQRMEALLKDLLAYTQVSRITEEEIVPTDLNRAIRDVVANLQAVASETRACITYGELPTIPMHNAHAQQLFQNLVGNAIKYRSEQPPRVHISAVEQNGCWLFSVQDNGIGVDAAYKERIFGLFKRLHTSDKYSGTGIGLAICHRIVERYHGKIWVESEIGKGSTFFFTLPR